MRLRCPRCQKKLTVPDKYGGKAIRCPACNRAFSVPKATASTGRSLDTARMDLEGLASLERRSTELTPEELRESQSAIDLGIPAKRAASANMRTCPSCQKETKVEDLYAEVLCSHCWNPIPAMIKGEVWAPRKTAVSGGPSSFYAELATSVVYPIPALPSLLTAAAIAIGAGLVPVAVMTVLAHVMQLGDVGLPTGVQKPDLTGVQWILVGIFAAEVFFFTAVATHVFLDVIRATTIGDHAPPNLGWGIAHWGKSFFGYVVIAIYLSAMTALMVLLCIPGDPMEYLRKGEVIELIQQGGTPLLLGLLVISFGIPMNLLGLALANVAQALHPVRVLKSVAQTHVHYAFLVVLLTVYGLLFAGAFAAIVLEWLVPEVGKMGSSAAKGDLAQVAIALAVWGLVMAFYFYGLYVLARLHGVFARSFRKGLFFGTM